MAKEKYNIQMIFDMIDNATPGLEKLKVTMGVLAEFGKGLAAGLAIPVTIGALAAGVKAAINFGDELNKLSEKSGVAADNLSALAYAGELADVDITGLTGGLKHLNQNLIESLDKGSDAADAFRQIGIATTDVTGKLRPTENILEDLAELFANTKNDAEKSALAIKLFGRAGLDMIPFLNQGKEAIKELKEEAQDFGIFWTPEQASSADEFNDNLTRLGNVIKGLFTQIAQALLPTLISLSEALIESAKDGGTLSGVVDALVVGFKALDIIVRITAIAINVVSNAFNALGKYLGVVSAAVVSFLSGDFKGASRIMEELQKVTDDTRKSIGNFAEKMIFGRDASNKATDANKKASIGFKGVSDSAKKAAEETKKAYEELNKYVEGLETAADKSLIVSEKEKKIVDLENKVLEARKKGVSEAQLIEQLNRGISAIEREQENKDFVDNVKADVNAIREANKVRQQEEIQKREFIKTTKEETEWIEFENSLYGLSNDERILAIETRRIEIESIKQTGEVLDSLVESRRKAITTAIENAKADRLLGGTYASQRAEYERNKAFIIGQFELGRISRETLEEAIDQLPEEALNAQERTQKEMKQSMEQTVADMQGIWSNGFFDWMQGKSVDLVSTVKTAIDRMVADMLAAQLQLALFGDIGKGGSGATGLLGGLFKTVFGGFRAGGGRVNAGSAYIVGEKRPELFIPDSNGTISPNVGSPTINLNITAMDSVDVRRVLEKDKRWIADMFLGASKTYNLQGAR